MKVNPETPALQAMTVVRDADGLLLPLSDEVIQALGLRDAGTVHAECKDGVLILSNPSFSTVKIELTT